MRCSECGSELPDRARYCVHCGHEAVKATDNVDLGVQQRVGTAKDSPGLVGVIQSGSSPILVGGEHHYDYGQHRPPMNDQHSMASATTIDRLGDKMDKIAGQIHELDKRVQRLEDGMRALEAEMRSSPGYSRAYLATGAAIMGVMLALLLFLTWRML